jgi:hypothetical protein
MLQTTDISLPFVFNPLKHHLAYIREFLSEGLSKGSPGGKDLTKQIKRIGTSVMDIYTGSLTIDEICLEVLRFKKSQGLESEKDFSAWAGEKISEYCIISLSDTSQWMLKYRNDRNRYVHLFPARFSPHSFRAKANTLKSAIIYQIITGKDFITRNDLNRAREYIGLSPVKGPAEAEAITEMIEILRQ